MRDCLGLAKCSTICVGMLSVGMLSVGMLSVGMLSFATAACGSPTNPTALQTTVQEGLSKISIPASKQLLDPVDLSELPPVVRINWLRDAQYLLTCKGKLNLPVAGAIDKSGEMVAQSVRAMTFYRFDVTGKTVAVTGTQQQFHNPEDSSGWHIADVGQAILLFPLTAPAQFEASAPVYRWNTPGGWAVQPYGSVNRSFLKDLAFSAVKEEKGKAMLQLYNGRGEVNISSSILNSVPRNGVPGLDQLRDCGMAASSGRYCGVLGSKSTDRELWQLAFFSIPRTVESAAIEVPLHWINHKLLCLPETPSEALEVATSFASPVVIAPQDGQLLFWRHQRLKSRASAEMVDLYECVRHDLGDNEHLIDWFAVSLPNNKASAMILDPKTKQWHRAASSTGQVAPPGELPPAPLLACSPDGKTLVTSRAWVLSAVQLEDDAGLNSHAAAGGR